MRLRLLNVGILTLAALAAATPARSQGQGPFVQHEPRAMARVVYFSDSAGGNPIAGEYAIEYGKPEWRAEYDAKFDEMTRGQRLRLGKDWWTTLTTFCPLAVGEKGELKAGQYFLALDCSDKGDWSLVALDPEPLRKSKMDAFGSSQTKGGVRLPLKHETTADAAKELEIRFLAVESKPREQTLEIRFGKHRLAALVQPKL